MKVLLLLIISTFCICAPLGFIGKCGMAPKYRPLECYKNSVLEEDMKELTEIVSKFKNGGDDKEFANLLGDMFDKKKYREKKDSSNKIARIGGCGMHPKYLPVECYEQNILRRDRDTIRDVYKQYHENDLRKFNEIYLKLIEKKYDYFNNLKKNK